MKKLKNASLFIITLLLFVILAPSASAFANSPASCDGYGSEQCRSTKNGNILSAKGVISQLKSATNTSKVIVGTNNRYTAKGNPTNYYRDIGIKYVVNGSTVNNGYFSSMFDFNETIFGGSEKGWYDCKEITPDDYKRCCFETQAKMGDFGFVSNIIENHDEPRGVSHYIPEGDCCDTSKKMLAALNFMLRGLPFIYQGQELGMINTHFDNIDELDDINSKGQFARCIEAGYSEAEAMESVNIRSRDQSRLPMQWNSDKNFGFSVHEPWLACNNQCDLQTVELESADKDSVLNFYKAMIQLRNHSEYTQTLIYGDLEDVETDNAGIIVYRRKPVQIECACGTGANAESTDRSVYVVVNMTGEDVGYAIPETADVLMGNYADYDGTLRPYETVVYAV